MTDSKYLIGVTSLGSTLVYYSYALPLELGVKVIVDNPAIGITVGTVQTCRTLDSSASFPSVIRLATREDLALAGKNAKTEKDIFDVVVDGAKRNNLNMKIISTIISLDFSKLLVIYSADERIDFRELVKELHRTFHTHIEMKQIGSRDRAQMIGGIGVCGLPLCCSTFIKNFDIISINMAKNQMLSLNIPKLSGQCGKLICCLKYEDDNYSELRKTSPRIGERYQIKNSEYRIISLNLITGMISLSNNEEIIVVNKSELSKYKKVYNEHQS